MCVFLGPFGVKANENLAIADLNPPMDKADFYPMEDALLQFMQDEHQVRQLEVEQCPFGDAFARFSCPLDRLRFLRSPLHIGQYSLRFIKHDEASNVSAIDMDREAWIMMLGFPNDYREDHEIDKAVSGFAILKHIHRSSNAGRVIVKVLVNKEDDILVIAPGDSLRAPTWTIPIFILHAQDLSVYGDEDALPHFGPLHPLRNLLLIGLVGMESSLRQSHRMQGFLMKGLWVICLEVIMPWLMWLMLLLCTPLFLVMLMLLASMLILLLQWLLLWWQSLMVLARSQLVQFLFLKLPLWWQPLLDQLAHQLPFLVESLGRQLLLMRRHLPWIIFQVPPKASRLLVVWSL